MWKNEVWVYDTLLSELRLEENYFHFFVENPITQLSINYFCNFIFDFCNFTKLAF